MTGNNAIHLSGRGPATSSPRSRAFPPTASAPSTPASASSPARATPLGRYQSLASIRVQRLGGAGSPVSTRRAQNRFGALDDMSTLENTLRARARASLAEVMRGSDEASASVGGSAALLELLRRARRGPGRRRAADARVLSRSR